MKKRGGHSSIVFSFVHSEWFSNGKMKLKSDIRINILNDRYRPIIDLYVFKKKQTNKQQTKKTKQIMYVSKSVIKKRNQPPTNKETNKNKNKTTTTTIKREMTI